LRALPVVLRAASQSDLVGMADFRDGLEFLLLGIVVYFTVS